MWTDVQHRDGTVDWTSPAGRKYTNTPDGPLPEMRPVPDIAHLIDKAKHQNKALATATADEGMHGKIGEGETGTGARPGVEVDSGIDGNQRTGTTTPSDANDPPPF